jgi:hypothetical protein
MADVALTEQQWHTLVNQDPVLAAVREECARELALWHGESHPPIIWLGFITEQVGQAASAIVSRHPQREDDIERQLIHIAAVCVSAIEDIRRHSWQGTAAANTSDDRAARR